MDKVPITVGDGRQTVTTPGTAVQLSTTSVRIRSVAVTAETDNGDVVSVGGPGVLADLATRRGTPLAAGETMTLDIHDLNKVYLDAVVAGEGVTYTYTS